MRSQFLLFVAFTIGSLGVARANDSSQPPAWAVSAVSKKSSSLKPAEALGFGIQSDDFNGDGKEDIVLVVQDEKTKKVGLAFVHGGSNEVFVLGAGTNVVKLGDDFLWLDRWALEPVPARSSQKSTLGLWIAGKDVDGWLTWRGQGYVWVPAPTN